MKKLTIKEYKQQLLLELEEISKNPQPFHVEKVEIKVDPNYEKLKNFIDCKKGSY